MEARIAKIEMYAAFQFIKGVELMQFYLRNNSDRPNSKRRERSPTVAWQFLYATEAYGIR
jgi:hypothetical protein